MLFDLACSHYKKNHLLVYNFMILLSKETFFDIQFILQKKIKIKITFKWRDTILGVLSPVCSEVCFLF